MNRPRRDIPVVRSFAELADVRDLRTVIATALAARPADVHSLRRGIWNYVNFERATGTSAPRVVVALMELLERAHIAPTSARQPLRRQIMLWSVEAYFGQYGGVYSNTESIPVVRAESEAVDGTWHV